MNERENECVYVGLKNRMETWALLEAATYALRKKKGFHKTTVNPEFAVELLKSVDWALGWRGKSQWNDPIIAEDVGGDLQLWAIRLRIRKTIELIEDGELRKACKMVDGVKGFFLKHASTRFLECLGGEPPISGVSYRHITNQIEMTDEMKVKSEKMLRAAKRFLECGDEPL